MKINFNSMKIKNFYSYKNVEFKFKNGIYLVEGINKDKNGILSHLKTSNGAGKTAFFASIYQALFNKNIKNNKATIATVNNIYSDTPYEIELDLNLDKENYLIVNSRVNGDISILNKGKNIAPKGVPAQLNFIQDLIKFNFEMFSSITYLNSQSLENVLDLTNKDSMLYQFFEVDKIKEYEKGIKRFINKTKSNIDVEKAVIETSKASLISLNQKYKELINTDLPELDSLSTKLEKLKNKYPPIILKHQQKLDILIEQLRVHKNKSLELKIEINKIREKGKTLKEEYDLIKAGVCPICNNKIDSQDVKIRLQELKKLKKHLIDKEQEEKSIEDKIKNIEKEIDTVKNYIQTMEDEYINNRNNIIREIDKVKTRDKLLKSKKETEDEYNLKIKESEDIVNELEIELAVATDLLEIIKSGKLLDLTLENYTTYLQKFYNYYKELTGFEINCEIYYKNGKILNDFFTEDNAKVTFSNLSTGERTRVAIIFLISTLRTLEMLLNISINFLVLDELLGALDEDGVEMLKNILNDLKKDKSIFLITHHNEIEPEFSDFIMIVEKSNKTSQIVIKENYAQRGEP